MSDPHPIMMMILESNSFVGPAERVEDTLTPIDEQLNFSVGDTAILAMANTALEHDFVILKMLDASKHAETYPNWEEREELGAHVLCEAFSRLDPELRLGWYHRLKIFPISNYRYRQARKWLKDGFPEEVPDWAEAAYLKYSELLSKQAPDIVPRVVHCPNCKGPNVALVVTRTLEYMARAGVIEHEGEEHIVPITEVDEKSSHVAVLRCLDCETPADLTDAEWSLPGISK
jgi:hypothetical protein